MKKRQCVILVIAIITLGMCLIGGTYAYLFFSNVNIVGNVLGQTSCFLVDYDYRNDDGTTELGGTLFQTSVPKTGLSGKVSMAINDECNMCSLGSIYLKVNNTTDSILYKKVNKAHCEDPRTLKTMTEYKTSSTCTSNGYNWVNNVSALKYAVYNESSDAPLSVGYIDGVKDITLYSGFHLSTASKKFDIYVWLDGELADNSYLGVSFDGDIHLGAEQTEENCPVDDSIELVGEAYAVYSESDNSLRFYRSETPITVEDGEYRGLPITAVYTGFETEVYELGGLDNATTPWHLDEKNFVITSVIFEDYISPISTAWWFYEFNDCSIFNVSKLITSQVTNMREMFSSAGHNATTFTLTGLGNWDTSSVTNMREMFYFAGVSATTFTLTGLENWDTSNVTDMSYMFHYAGWSANTFTITGLENWDTSQVTNMNSMFLYVGSDAETWSIGDLSDWDTSNVTDMSYMFSSAGQSAETWNIGDLGNWDTSNVTDMSNMFSSAGYFATTFTLTGLENWDTSSVTNMSYMFNGAGSSSTNNWTLDLSGWNVCRITSRDYFSGENGAGTINLPSWGMACPS